MRLGVVDLLEVDAERHGDVRILRRRRDDHLARAGLEVLRRAGAARKSPVDSITTSTPSSAHGSLAGSVSPGTAIASAVDDQRALDDLHRPRERPVDGVVLEQLREQLRVGDVVDRDPLDRGLSLVGGAERGPAGAAEAVDRNSD